MNENLRSLNSKTPPCKAKLRKLGDNNLDFTTATLRHFIHEIVRHKSGPTRAFPRRYCPTTSATSRQSAAFPCRSTLFVGGSRCRARSSAFPTSDPNSRHTIWSFDRARPAVPEVTCTDQVKAKDLEVSLRTEAEARSRSERKIACGGRGVEAERCRCVRSEYRSTTECLVAA